MAKHISYSLRDYQIAMLAELTAIKFRELYEQRFPVPKDNIDEETDKSTDMR